jgi:hypothetical protein
LVIAHKIGTNTCVNNVSGGAAGSATDTTNCAAGGAGGSGIERYLQAPL